MFKNKDRGISTVTGGILMLLVTVIVSAVIAQFVLGINILGPSINAGVTIQETGNNKVEVQWKDKGNAEKIKVEINGVKDSTLNSLGESAELTINDGDTVSAVGVKDDKESVVASEKFGTAVASETSYDYVILVSTPETPTQFKINEEIANPDSSITIGGAEYYKFLFSEPVDDSYTISGQGDSVQFKQETFDFDTTVPASGYDFIDYPMAYPTQSLEEKEADASVSFDELETVEVTLDSINRGSEFWVVVGEGNNKKTFSGEGDTVTYTVGSSNEVQDGNELQVKGKFSGSTYDIDSYTVEAYSESEITNKQMEGEGTESDPKLVETTADFDSIEHDNSAVYKLQNNIDASSVDKIEYFYGKIYGNNKEIQNVSINDLINNRGGTIKNVSFTSIDIQADYAKLLDNGGTLENVSYSGTIETASDTGASVIGSNSGTIINNNSSVNVTGEGSVSGLVDLNWGEGVVKNSTVSGTIKGDSRVGGLIATMDQEPFSEEEFPTGAVVKNNTFTGELTATENVGGIVGVNKIYSVDSDGSTDIKGVMIEDSTVTGTINIEDHSDDYATNIGGVAGVSYGNIKGGTVDVTINNNAGSTELNDVGGVVGKITTEQDYDSDYTSTASISNISASGSIDSAHVGIGGLVGVVEDDDSISGTGEVTISNSNSSVDINSVEQKSGGLVGINYADISNSYATGNINGTNKYVGGLVGTSEDSSITGSYAEGNVTGGDDVGGLVGNVEGSSTIDNNYATGDVSGTRHVGGLIGYSSVKITDSDAEGNVTGTEDEIGGLAGTVGGIIKNSTASGNVTGNEGEVGGVVGSTEYKVISTDATGNVTGNKDDVGGLVGRTTANIEDSSASGDVESSDIYVGGLVGYSEGNILNSSSTGSVDSTSNTGGLVGEFNGTKISDSTAEGNVTGTGDEIGGIVGDSDGKIINTDYLSGTVTGKDYVGGVAGETDNIVKQATASGTVTGENSVGGVVGETPTEIRKSSGLAAVSGDNLVGGVVGHTDGKVINSDATGSVDGDEDVGGLVGYSSQSKIKNSSASGPVSGNRNIGGLVGQKHKGDIISSDAEGGVTIRTTDIGNMAAGGLIGLMGSNGFEGGSIEDSTASGDVDGKNNDYIGGLVGRHIGDTGSILNSSASGTVSGSAAVGGLVGTTDHKVENSSASGTVTGENSVGGLVGSGDEISSSYATGNVTETGEDYGNVGGLVGSTNSSVSNSFAVGDVDGTSGVGGLIGDHEDVSLVNDSYWDTESTGQSSSEGGTGLTTSEMTGSSAESNMTGFDFSSTWDTVSGDYPELQNTP